MLLNLKELMKLVFTAAEVLDIVLQHVRQEFPRAYVNTAEVVGYSLFTEVAVSYVPENMKEDDVILHVVGEEA